ncbi:hypothetical protein ACMA5K_33995 [Bradyrhizobium diazoefficiens]|uniref:hypothetical protein n=1 Tax=Bradyrhizobium diazoefficiens TaxID=1355477 RepID=UPI0015B52A66|nr:hypothetical protein [Bradyrhizobium diazoefficiens]QLD45632.1 hypothetical protein HUW42_33655 [Bradyrhizobium diazoefficiens]
MTDDKSKGSSKQPPIIESPDGIRIQISTSNKMKFRNAVHADKQLPEMMKSILYFLIDKTNDGNRDEARKFGWAYPLPATIAEHCGCTVRTVWNNLAALEDGVTKDGVTISERWRIRVNRHGQTKGKGGGRSKKSWYFLNAWHEFGVVDKPGRYVRTGKLHHVSGAYGGFSFLDEADGEFISTTDGMSRRQQFIALANLHHDMFGPVDQSTLDQAWRTFVESEIHFTTAQINISMKEKDGRDWSTSLVECLTKRLFDIEGETEEAEAQPEDLF